MVALRQTGHSLPEIWRLTGNAYSTVFKYIEGVEVLPQYVQRLKEKQGGSKARAAIRWRQAGEEAKAQIGPLTQRDRLMLLLALYWGEGTKKRTFSLINGDHDLIRVFVSCLRSIGIPDDRLKVGIRIFDDMNVNEMKRFWAGVCGVDPERIREVEIVKGTSKKKLAHGMCRVGTYKCAPHFKLIMSMIDCIKSVA